MTADQEIAVKCAFADLCGAMQAYLQGDIHAHDWEAHEQTLYDMGNAFDFLDPIPANITGETK